LPSDGPRQAAPEPRGINIKRMLRLRLPLMIAVSAVIAVPGLAAVWFLTPTQFSASTQIRYTVTGPGILEDNQGPRGREYDQFLTTEDYINRGPNVLLRVLAAHALQQMACLLETDYALS